jgi:hypothetical protein
MHNFNYFIFGHELNRAFFPDITVFAPGIAQIGGVKHQRG